jgi:hypothetical protein
MAVMGVAEALDVARKRRTTDGRVTVEFDDLHAAALARGMGFVKPTVAMRAVRELGGVRISNGRRGARYAIDKNTMENISNRAQYERGVNRIEGIEVPVVLIASVTFPVGLELLPHDFAAGPLIASAADLKVTAVRNFESLEGEPVECEGAWIALTVRKGSTADAALSLIVKGEHEAAEGDAYANMIMRPGVDNVSLAVTFADGSCADFTTGVMLHVIEWSECREYLFHFSQTNRDY